MSDVGIDLAGLILFLTVAATLVAFLMIAALAGVVALFVPGAAPRGRRVAIRALKMGAFAAAFLVVPIAVMNSGDNPRPAWIDELAWPWIAVFAVGCWWLGRPLPAAETASGPGQPITPPPG